jgi:hypothetical protein
VSNDPHPLIIYVPGLLPKPEPGIHRDALLRCLLTGISRVDEDVAAEIEGNSNSFDIVSWTYDFYREHRDFGIDAAAVDELVEQEVASPEDVAEATSWRRQLTRWIYALGNMLPFLIPHLATERMEVHLRDLRRYLRDDNGIATHTRRMLKMRLRAAAGGRHPTLLIGHSMGSVIAYDTLWELSESGRDRLQLDMLLTMGSPIGQRYMQKRLKGADQKGYARYPANIRRWRNLSAVGDMTALDPYLADDFEEMLELGILEDFEDEVIHTHFRLRGALNVHSEYGYLVNPRTAHTVIDWWRQHSA